MVSTVIRPESSLRPSSNSKLRPGRVRFLRRRVVARLLSPVATRSDFLRNRDILEPSSIGVPINVLEWHI